MIETNQIQELKKNGILKIKNFLSNEELGKCLEILKYYKAPKNHKNSFFAHDPKQFLIKLIKLEFKKFNQSAYLYSLSKKKKLNDLANNVFNTRSFLRYIDGYHNPVSDKYILPWHADQAYVGDEKMTDGFVNPDHYNLKFLVYLTDVESNNGCTSYIPGSNKIAYAIRDGIFKKKINYQPYYFLQDFRKLISNKNNKEYFESYFKGGNEIEIFMQKTKFIEEGKDTDEFDFSLKAGDAIVLDEGGIHKGSQTLKSERMMMRFFYSVKK